ncbi:MAG TPA: hypothetical protein DC049_01670, partial [Spirochaetia bacterium]|nr:hypothetical protein [Spirochaetia bacterium]
MPVFILLISSLLAAADWNPVESEPKIVKNTLMDFSMTQVSPAGQYGFVQAAPDGELYFEKKPDQKIRFYGGNITFGVNFPDKEQAVKLADLFAAMGYNVIRFHHHDTVVPWSKSLYEISGDRISFIPDQADRFDYLLSELRKRGIYYFSDVICSSLIDKHPAFAKYGNNSKARKFLYHLTPEGRSLFLQIATLFLTHVNPYTGLAYKDDPALILLGLVNEDSPVNLTGADKDEFSPELMNYVLGEFNAFILKKYHAEPAAEFH